MQGTTSEIRFTGSIASVQATGPHVTPYLAMLSLLGTDEPLGTLGWNDEANEGRWHLLAITECRVAYVESEDLNDEVRDDWSKQGAWLNPEIKASARPHAALKAVHVTKLEQLAGRGYTSIEESHWAADITLEIDGREVIVLPSTVDSTSQADRVAIEKFVVSALGIIT